MSKPKDAPDVSADYRRGYVDGYLDATEWTDQESVDEMYRRLTDQRGVPAAPTFEPTPTPQAAVDAIAADGAEQDRRNATQPGGASANVRAARKGALASEEPASGLGPEDDPNPLDAVACNRPGEDRPLWGDLDIPDDADPEAVAEILEDAFGHTESGYAGLHVVSRQAPNAVELKRRQDVIPWYRDLSTTAVAATTPGGEVIFGWNEGIEGYLAGERHVLTVEHVMRGTAVLADRARRDYGVREGAIWRALTSTDAADSLWSAGDPAIFLHLCLFGRLGFLPLGVHPTLNPVGGE
jgi:hypothetical protein